MPPVASWLLAGALPAWIAVRQVIRPFSQFTRAVDSLDPSASSPMTETGPVEVQRAAHAFNAMQARIQSYLRERAQIPPPYRTTFRLDNAHEVARRNGGPAGATGQVAQRLTI